MTDFNTMQQMFATGMANTMMQKQPSTSSYADSVPAVTLN